MVAPQNPVPMPIQPEQQNQMQLVVANESTNPQQNQDVPNFSLMNFDIWSLLQKQRMKIK